MAGEGRIKSEALTPHRLAALGRIQINTPPAFWAMSLLAAAFVCTTVAYVFLGHYTRRVTVDGVLVPAAGLVTLSATGSGQVLRVDVRPGERVDTGQALAEFDSSVYSTTIGNTLSFVSFELKEQRKGLLDDLTTSRKIVAGQEATLRANISSLEAQAVEISGQLALQRQEASAMEALLKRIAPLSRQAYISVYDLQKQQSVTLNAEMQVKALRRQRLEIKQQLLSAEEQLREIPTNLAVQQNDTRGKLAQVEQALAQNEVQRAWVLKAPRPGVISTVLVKSGQAVTAGEPLVVVVPLESRLEAQLLVPSSAIGFVRDGQRVVLRYQAFPYQTYGLQFGLIKQVSRSALSPEEVTLLAGEEVAAPFYRVLVQMNHQGVEASGHFFALRPGMALSADILLDRQRLIEWVLEPLYGFGRTILETRVSGGASVPAGDSR